MGRYGEEYACHIFEDAIHEGLHQEAVRGHVERSSQVPANAGVNDEQRLGLADDGPDGRPGTTASTAKSSRTAKPAGDVRGAATA